MDSNEEQTRMMEMWSAKDQFAAAARRKPLNYMEITRIPKKISAKSLTSMIMTASRIVPKSVEICYRGEDLEVIGVIEYKTASDAYRAAEKIRASSFGQGWIIKLMEEPQYTNPEKEAVNKLSSNC